MLVERELDLLDGETWHGPEACASTCRNRVFIVSTYLRRCLFGLTGPVLARTFGAGYESIEGGCESGRHVDQRRAGIYGL